MSESLKVLKARFVDTTIDLRKSLLSTTGHQHVELDLLDDLILIHNEMIKEICDVVDKIEADPCDECEGYGEWLEKVDMKENDND